ncbi:MAG: Rpn family recombination-promoting nuclease/putative transposase [Clostridia bacterium]|nr:Rpn family recombination-promoting nuclease/putative transposase [Clostridia bacterium]NCC42417.1 Rpn family recombination-promoting nuclease/putative transposase [Clostridia bacterium]
MNEKQVTHAQSIPLLKNLNLTNRFLFDAVMEDAETHQAVLSIIFQHDIGLLPQNEVEKQLQTLPFLRSVRLDVFSMDEEHNVYNSEMQKNYKSDLRKRSRFYQALIDASLLPMGILNYNQLNDSYMIMITPFDIFGFGLYQYTFEAKCREVPELSLGDGATRIFLNTRGTNPEEVGQELVDLLKYVEDTSDTVAEASESELIKKIHKRVKEVKSSEEMGVKYMQAWEEKAYEREEGREEGRILGEIDLVRKKMNKGLSVEQIADFLEEPLELIEKVCQLLQADPDMSTEEIRLRL